MKLSRIYCFSVLTTLVYVSSYYKTKGVFKRFSTPNCRPNTPITPRSRSVVEDDKSYREAYNDAFYSAASTTAYSVKDVYAFPSCARLEAWTTYENGDQESQPPRLVYCKRFPEILECLASLVETEHHLHRSKILPLREIAGAVPDRRSQLSVFRPVDIL